MTSHAFNSRHTAARSRGQARCARGQMLVLFTLFLVVLVLFAGLVVDLGFAYQTKAALSKAADAAALTGARNVFLGAGLARSLAAEAFASNYPVNGRDIAPPQVTVTFGRDDAEQITVDVSASVQIGTFLLRVLPPWRALTVGADAQAVRSRLVMDLVLDRSYSMTLNGGSNVLGDAVSAFVDAFEDSYDEIGLTSFSTTTRDDVTIQYPFKALVSARARSLDYEGATYADGGLRYATQKIRERLNRMTPSQASNAVKVVLFFTDGYANGHIGLFPCPTPQPLLLSSNDRQIIPLAIFLHDTNGNMVASCIVPDSDTTCPGTDQSCPIPTEFVSISGQVRPATAHFVQVEGELRAEATARSLRAARTLIFAVGLGDQINAAFLKRVANDPTSPTVDPNQPQGLAVVAVAAQDLQPVLQDIASKILIRLTR